MNTVLRSLNTLLGQIDGAYHDAAVQMGVSDSVMNILYGILAEGDGCNQSVLYKNTGTGKTTVNSAIRRMEKDGLLYLKPGEGRNTRVFLTDKGHMVSERTAGRLMRIEEDIIASWPENDKDVFLGLMQRYLEQLVTKTREELK